MQGLMRVSLLLVLCTATALGSSLPVQPRQGDNAGAGESPVSKVTNLLNSISNEIRTDSRKEQMSYDKYACWCEDTTHNKAHDISKAETSIDELSQDILKWSGDIGVHTASVKQLKKDVASNIAATKEAEDVRRSDNEQYLSDKAESEQSIAALDSAIKLLTGTGTFLQHSVNDAALLGVAQGVATVLRLPASKLSGLSDDDMDVMKQFVSTPRNFVGKKTTGASLAQNPFGDYAPASTQIQGALKSLFDSITADLEKSKTDEASHQKSFESLKETKATELETLTEKLSSEQENIARVGKQLADSKEMRANTQAQMKEDKKFFEDTKQGCRQKALDWAKRTKLISEELQGIRDALKTFSDPSGATKAVFNRSHRHHHSLIHRKKSLQFFQKSIVSQHETKTIVVHQHEQKQHHESATSARNAAVSRLHALAAQYRNYGLARIAADLKLTGHFDKVIDEIDEMIKVLRAEEQEDIEHRDRCQSKQAKNKHMLEDLASAISNTDGKIEQLTARAHALRTDVEEVKKAMDYTQKEIADLTANRDEEHAEFLQALKDDQESVDAITSGLQSLSSFYTNNKISLLQQPEDAEAPPAREYTVDPNKAPEVNWKGGANYQGNSGTKYCISLLETIRTDLENEIKAGRKEDADARANFLESKQTLQDTMDAQDRSKVGAESDLADVQDKISDSEEAKAHLTNDQNAQNELKDTLDQDCAWVASHFNSRREKRKGELDGLQEAKDFLAGVEQDSAEE